MKHGEIFLVWLGAKFRRASLYRMDGQARGAFDGKAWMVNGNYGREGLGNIGLGMTPLEALRAYDKKMFVFGVASRSYHFGRFSVAFRRWCGFGYANALGLRQVRCGYAVFTVMEKREERRPEAGNFVPFHLVQKSQGRSRSGMPE